MVSRSVTIERVNKEDRRGRKSLKSFFTVMLITFSNKDTVLFLAKFLKTQHAEY